MKHIKKVLEIFVLDWKRILKHPVAALLVLALMIIPSLYAWFNIKALWNPYENTSELPIAVYSADAGTTFQDKEIEIGGEVIKNLHDNKQLGWQFVDSKAELVKGVESGKYYAGIYLPKEFSENLMSFTTGEIQKPKIEYYVNQKINAVAPKITDKGATSIQTTISDEFINTASSTLMTVFNEVGYNLDANLLSINKITNLITQVAANSDEIDQYAAEIVSINDKLPTIKEKLALVQEFESYLPQVDALADKLVELNDKFPEIKEKASIILTLEDKIPEIESAADQLAQVDSDFETIEKTMNDGISEAKAGLTVLQDIQTLLPTIETLLNNTSDAVNIGEDALTKIQGDLPANLGSIIDATVRVLQGASLNVEEIATNLAGLATEDNKETIKTSLGKIDQLIGAQVTSLDNVLNTLKFIENQGGNVGDLINALDTVQKVLEKMQTRVSQVITHIDEGASMATIQQELNDLANLAKGAQEKLASIDGNEVASQIQTGLSKALETLQAADTLLTKAQALDLASFLTATQGTVSDAITLLEKYQQQLPAIKSEIHDANTLLNGHLSEIIAGIHTGADLYRNELPTLETRLGQAADFVENDWPGIESDLEKAISLVDEKFPEVEKALGLASDLIKEDWPMLKTGLQKAADAIAKGEKDFDLSEIISLLKLDATQESDFFTTPVELVTNDIYPVPNNGSASTPFYTALCLWVGALLLSSVATTDVYLKDSKKKYSSREMFLGRWLTFLVIGLAQGLIVSLGNLFLLDVYAVSPSYTVLFALLIAVTFMTMVYVLAALFGNIGKGIAIIILVLSISGGGGNYPIQLSGKFFQAVNPILPFTHAVNLLREPVGGIYWPNAWHAMGILVGVWLLFLVVGIIAYPKVSKAAKKLAEHSHLSHFFH